jgi:hypothetical protein
VDDENKRRSETPPSLAAAAGSALSVLRVLLTLKISYRRR